MKAIRRRRRRATTSRSVVVGIHAIAVALKYPPANTLQGQGRLRLAKRRGRFMMFPGASESVGSWLVEVNA